MVSGATQSGIDPALLKRLFPAAAAFSPKAGAPFETVHDGSPAPI
jgi:hypothetical protein